MNWNLIPEFIRMEMDLRIGIHDGYIQVASQNVGALFIITPYLIAVKLRNDKHNIKSPLLNLSLIMTIAISVLSGRRALWLVMILCPCIIYLLSYFSNALNLINSTIKTAIKIYGATCIVLAFALVAIPGRFENIGSIKRLQEAFSREDERTIQKGYLIDGFKTNLVFGTGFGAYAGYLRNEERPWTYELTYHKILFNMGFVGTFALTGLIFLYFVKVITIMRKFKQDSLIPFGLLTGYISLLIGAYSNPYFGSFDYLFFAGLLPFLASFNKGYA